MLLAGRNCPNELQVVPHFINHHFSKLSQVVVVVFFFRYFFCTYELSCTIFTHHLLLCSTGFCGPYERIPLRMECLISSFLSECLSCSLSILFALLFLFPCIGMTYSLFLQSSTVSSGKAVSAWVFSLVALILSG